MYQRQQILPEIGPQGQAILANSTVLILGLGGLGCPAALYLATAGVGTLILVDHDTVEPSNLHRQILYTQQHIGQAKSEAAKNVLLQHRPDLHTQLVTHTLSIEELPTLLASADVAIDASDNFTTKFAMNKACQQTRTPIVIGAGLGWSGQCTVLDFKKYPSPCYACLFPNTGEAARNCASQGVVGPIVGLIGNLMALATLKILLDLPTTPTFTQYDGLNNRWHSHVIASDPTCPLCSKA